MNYRKRTAAGVLAAMLAVSSFSVGIYAEEEAYTAEDTIEEGTSGASALETGETGETGSSSETDGALIIDTNTDVQNHSGTAADGSKESAKKVIAGFAKVGMIASITYDQGSKPSLEQLRKKLPSEVSVFFAGESEPTSVPVTWVSGGSDYSRTDDSYYLFLPRFDADQYVVIGMDPIRQAPYVEVKKNYAINFQMITSAPPTQNEKAVFQFCTQKLGLNAAAACGILANMYCESGFRTDAIGDGHTSFGLCQWHNGRWTNLRNYTSDWQTVEGQLKYMAYELTGGYSGTLNCLRSVSNDAQGAYDAGYYWCVHFESPDSAVSRGMTRGYLAKNVYWERYKDGLADSTVVDDDSCGCNDSFAGDYTVKAEGGLHMRSGHSADSPSIALIPDGSSVKVEKADGTWAHVVYTDENKEELKGLCKMEYLDVVMLDSEKEEAAEADAVATGSAAVAAGEAAPSGEDAGDADPDASEVSEDTDQTGTAVSAGQGIQSGAAVLTAENGDV